MIAPCGRGLAGMMRQPSMVLLVLMLALAIEPCTNLSPEGRPPPHSLVLRIRGGKFNKGKVGGGGTMFESIKQLEERLGGKSKASKSVTALGGMEVRVAPINL